MPRPFAHVFVASFVAVITSSAALAGSAVNGEAATGENIFSAPNQSERVPSFTNTRGGQGAKLRQLLLGNTKDDIPDFKQILQLPTLTMAQRKQLRETFKGDKAELQPLLTKLRAMKEKRDTAGGVSSGAFGAAVNGPNAFANGGTATGGMREEFEALRAQIQQLRRESWEQIKPILSDAQIRDLEAMRKGELRPATFNEASSTDGVTMKQ